MITLAALCSAEKSYGWRFAYIAELRRNTQPLIGPPADEFWIVDAIKSEDGRRCEAASDAGASVLIRCSAGFRGCHYCAATSIFMCGCSAGHLCCASGDWEKAYRAPCCGREGRPVISGIAISTVTRPSPAVANLLRVPHR